MAVIDGQATSDYRAWDAPDHDEIVRIMHIYTDNFGAGKNNPQVFEEAFRDDAWMIFSVPGGTLVRERIWDCFEQWASPEGKGKGINCRIISLIQAGDIANVLLAFEDQTTPPDDYWVDLHNLIRVDGVWKITNKTATHSSTAGGA